MDAGKTETEIGNFLPSFPRADAHPETVPSTMSPLLVLRATVPHLRLDRLSEHVAADAVRPLAYAPCKNTIKAFAAVQCDA